MMSLNTFTFTVRGHGEESASMMVTFADEIGPKTVHGEAMTSNHHCGDMFACHGQNVV